MPVNEVSTDNWKPAQCTLTQHSHDVYKVQLPLVLVTISLFYVAVGFANYGSTFSSFLNVYRKVAGRAYTRAIDNMCGLKM